MRELSDGGRNLETLVENDLLALKADVFGPLDKASEVCLRLDILACKMFSIPRGRAEIKTLTNTEVLGVGLEEGVLLSLSSALADTIRGGSGLFSFGGLGLVIETRNISDVFESVMGAVLVDSGYNYEKAATVAEIVMEDVLGELSLDMATNPVSELLEWLAKQGCTKREIRYIFFNN